MPKKIKWPIILELPYPPTVNHMYITRRGGRKILTEVARQFRVKVVRACNSINACYFERFERYRLHIQVFRPDKRCRDTSNIIKATEDALERGGIFDNDFDIWRSSQERMEEIVKGGKIIIHLWGYNVKGMELTRNGKQK